MTTCYKIIQLQRHNYNDTFSYHFFPNKLLVWPTLKRKLKIKEYHFSSKAEVEEKYAALEKAKLKIGYQEINRIDKPKYYNLWREKFMNFWSFYKDNPKFSMYPPILDSDGELIGGFRTFSKKELMDKFPTTPELLDFMTPMQGFSIQVKINGDMYYHYRISVELFKEYGVIWDASTEPGDLLNCPLGHSLIQHIEEDANFKHSDEPNRILHFSKGLYSLIDMKTEKIYCVDDWSPNFHLAASKSNIDRHESLEDFYHYMWDRLDQDVGYSLENA